MKTFQHYLITLTFSASFLIVNGQEVIESSYNAKTKPDPEITYSHYKWTTSLIDEHSYILFPPFFDYKYNNFQWLPGEGRKSIIEAKISGVFDICSTGMYNKERVAKNHFKIAIAGSVNLRLTSEPGLTSPSIPPSNKIGLRIDYGKTGARAEGETFVLGHRLDIMHYSNGQAEKNYIDSLNRYNYANADFSTNYLRYTLFGATIITTRYDSVSQTLSKRDKKIIESTRYAAAYLFFQADGRAPGGLGDVFDYLPNDGNYGHWRTGMGFRFPISIMAKGFKKPLLFTVSSNLEYVFVNTVADIPVLSGTHKLIWHPYRVPWGIMAFYHHGRDYMNIRYLMPAQIFGVGIHLQNFLFGNRLLD
ncbi:hypothetical protein [Marinoscillum sp. MHG1-6]|uniref:hypothetical protein n=1 Tax=Marinoscillum sp. MHG1-6 TaxID=2959627 RepID=UPI0021571920|nr:hypothetical protein [Marinoscillum sp. MHG1-6]